MEDATSHPKIEEINHRINEVVAENRKLTRDIENMKNGDFLSEDYANCSWANRFHLDKQWLLLSGYQQHRIILKTDVDMYHDLMNYYYQFSPLIRGAIDLKTRYTFGLTFSIQSDNDANKKLIDSICNDPKNRIAVFGSQAIIEADHDLQKRGGIFLAFWPKTKPVQIRFWSGYEITDIITDPQDADMPMYYKRSWTDEKGGLHEAFYPSVFNDKAGTKIKLDWIPKNVDNNIIVYHISEGKGLKQKWALSPYTAALPWNRAYEGFLMDFAAIVQMIRKYTTMYTTKGGDAQISGLVTQFANELHGGKGGQVGEQLITTEGNDFKVIDAGNNKIVGLQDARILLLQFCAAVAIPENQLVGNPQTGNRASAQELAANFLPLIEERQTTWSDTFRMVFTNILGNTEFTISFPPLRSQDALTYLESLNSTAMKQDGTPTGVIRPIDWIKQAYESLDMKIPDDTTIDEMAAGLLNAVNQNPAMAQAIDRLAQAAGRMNEIAEKP